MSKRILSRRKWKLMAHGQHIIIVRGVQERLSHPLMKAFLWALYLPRYPNISVEIRIGDKYKPDVIAFEPGLPLHLDHGQPVFWGEAGQVGAAKIKSLVRRYRDTHFVIAKWDTRLDPFIDLVQQALKDIPRTAPFDLISFAPDSAERFIDEHGNIALTHDDLNWVQLS